MQKQVEIVEIHPDSLLEILTEASLPVSDIDPDSSTFYGAIFNNKVVGCIGFQELGETALLRSLAVKDSFQKQGLGKELTNKVIKEAGKRAKASIYLLTTDAELFFVRMGFQKIIKASAPDILKKTKQYSEICSDPAVVMKIDLA